MIKFLRKIFDKIICKEEEQTTYCFCPRCDTELISSESFVSDEDGVVTYKCINCGISSKWLFDAPAPILIK